MHELSLFTGAGGGLLGTHLLGWTPIGYVENDDYCQRIIAARIADGILRDAPIFGDIRAFISEGYADSYSGLVDVVTAGFPCQDLSVANRAAAGFEGERSGLWSTVEDVVRIVRPRLVLLENSPAILVRGFERVANDLASLGYGFRWGVLGAHHIGLPHKRERWWCVATDASGRGLERRHHRLTRRETEDRSVQTLRKNQVRLDIPEPGLFGSGNGMANRVDRTRAIGNGQVPAVVRAAWHLLMDD